MRKDIGWLACLHWRLGDLGKSDEVSAAWNAHSASFSPEESLFEHAARLRRRVGRDTPASRNGIESMRDRSPEPEHEKPGSLMQKSILTRLVGKMS